MRDGDTTALGGLAQESQDDAERLLRNQTPETSALVAIARRLGAFAASSFGAGFGGSVWALVGKEDAGSFPPRWLSEYRARFPGRDAATAFEARPGPRYVDRYIGSKSAAQIPAAEPVATDAGATTADRLLPSWPGS